jgi:hypothetical protein
MADKDRILVGGTTTYDKDKYLGRIHGKTQFTLVNNTFNAPDINATTITGSTVTGSTATFTTLTASQAYISNNLTVEDYLQLLPVNNTPIPTNQTASYIYTSGSTNDLYFTQYDPASSYNNTTRLRWLESGLESGLLSGGRLSTVNGTTTFSIASGSGIVATPNASLTSDPYPTIKYVQWSNFVSQSLPSITTTQITYIAINSSGSIVRSSSPFTDGDYANYIVLGRILHQTGSVTNGAVTAPVVAYGSVQNKVDFFRAFGPLKLSGHTLAASGSTLGLTKTAGNSFAIGRNYTVDPNMPNYVSATTDTALTVSKIYREHVSGSTLVLDTGVANAGYTDIDPTQRLVTSTGLLTSVPAGKYTLQRVFWFPNSVNKALHVYYGNTQYNSLDEAQAGINSEDFVEDRYTSTEAIFVAYICVKSNASNLSDAAEARIIQAGFARGVGGGAGGSSPGATGPAGGDLTGTYPDPTLATITTAGTSGSASVVPVVTIDTKGRVTTLSSATIAITTASVSGLGTAAGLASDTDGTLATNSDTRIATQKATKTYADTKVAKSGDTMTGQLTLQETNFVVSGSGSATGIMTIQNAINFNPVTEPPALTAVVLAVAGNVNVGTHAYVVVYGTPNGETGYSAYTSATTTAGSQQVQLTIPTSSDPRVNKRIIFRNLTNTSWYNDLKILTTINDNTTTTYTDNLADASRTGTSRLAYKENTTTKFMTSNSNAAGFVGNSSVVFGYNGYRNLFNNTATGGGNTCLGTGAGYNLSSGEQNVIISNSNTGISTGASNVLIHGNWGNNPNGCVSIGRNAQAVNSGTDNVTIGNSAGASVGHNYAVSIGVLAGNYFTGNGNISIGWQCNYSATSGPGAYNIAIGCAIRVPSTASSGQINIGNVIYGKNSYQSTALSSTPTSNGSIAIGLQDPTARFHLPAGTTTAATAPLKFTSGSNLTTVESGSMEYDGTHLYFSPVATRKIVTYRKSVSAVTSSLTASVDSLLAASGTFTITLPNPSTVGNGAEISVKKTSTGASTVTISASAGTIDGATTASLTTQYSSYTFVSDGSTNWWII